MAKAPDTSGYERFSDVTARLDEIIADVRKKDTSLERSLDLFDEAIALGTRAVDLVDKAAFSPRSASAWPSPSRRRMPMKARRPPGEFEAKDAAEHANADSADEAK